MIRNFIALLQHLGLSQVGIEEFARVAVFRHLRPGDMVSKKMESPNYLIYIDAGFVALRSQKKNASDNIYSFYTADTLVNENPALEHIRQVVDFIAITNCTLVLVPLLVYRKYLNIDDRFVAGMYGFTIQRSNRLKLAAAILRHGSPTFRIIVAMAHHAMVLNNESERRGADTLSNNSAFLNISHSLMSSMVGVSRGVFYQHLKAFADAGYINLEYKKMIFGMHRPLWLNVLRQIYDSGRIDKSMTLMEGVDWLGMTFRKLNAG